MGEEINNAEIRVAIGAKIKAWRIGVGLSVEQVAQTLKVSNFFVDDVEAGSDNILACFHLLPLVKWVTGEKIYPET